MTAMTNDQETYLGDGLYASFDGYQVKLRTPRENGDHEVFLEDSVRVRFLMWLNQHQIGVEEIRPPNKVSHEQ